MLILVGGGDDHSSIPARPIVAVSFPLRVQFRNRNYQGNPLAFFNMHRQTYACLSRKELVGFDKGLYQALWKARQIDQAIPEDNRFILSGERESIVEKLKANGGNVPLTAKQLGKSVSTVRYIAKERKLYVPQTLSHTLEERTRIVQSYERFNGNANEASRQLHVSSKNIRQYWREVGLKIIRNPINKLSDEEIQKIIQSHTIYGGDVDEVARHLPYSKSTIKRYWEKEGLDFTNNRNVLSQDDIGKIIGAYDGWNGNASRAGRALGYSTSSVLKYWKAAGLDISRARIKNPPRRKEMSA